jgi:S1-C subfamily serine protease
MYFKPSRYFNSNPNYDRSGLLMVNVGEEIKSVRKPVFVRVDENSNYGSIDADKFEIRLERSRIFQVAQIRPNSPASAIDIRIGDRILRLNGKSLDRMDMEEITELLSSEEGKRVKIYLKRGDVFLKRELYLNSQLQ